MSAPARVRSRIRVTGIVQGVGFRPFVHGLAGELGVVGFVGNDEAGVIIEAEGDPAALEKFVDALRSRAPALAAVEEVSAVPIPVGGDTAFTIAASESHGPRSTLISADSATCDDCLRELHDPADRRYRYPFINCTNCGPRFTIVTDVPYDRPSTTMAGFALCAACTAEYHDPTDRRFHAQPVCCSQCGPTLRLIDTAGQPVGESGDPIRDAATWLSAGAVLAVKGLGGFHLAARADHEQAVAALRGRKHREDKPFAVLAPDLAAVHELCELDEAELVELTSRRRPIVLLHRRPDARLAPQVAPGNRSLGVMLPYTPLHHLLVDAVGAPIVLTSGNISDEPIVYHDADAATRLRPIADGFLTHDRPIHIRADDSVLRVVGGRPMPLRRSRGYAPEPLPLAWPAPRQVLGCGAELKSTFCLAKGRHAFLSHHIGDLENYETLRSFTEGIEHFKRLFDIAPELVVHDLHPEYLSTKYALDLVDGDVEGVELLGVQHHHAHIASCLADNGEEGPVVGIACDGTGYGGDGTLWGGEVMVASLVDYRRMFHLEPVPLPGGESAIKEPWRMAASWLRVAYDGAPPDDLEIIARNGVRWTHVLRLLDSELDTPMTSSVGRLFDAVAALIGIRDAVNYEGQAAIELEQRVQLDEPAGYPARLEGELIRGGDLIRAVVEDVRAEVDPGTIAARFHNGVVDVLARAAQAACAETGLSTVALSGGVFQNVVLLQRVSAALSSAGLRVLTHSRVPPNDAGISLGQVAVAAARDRATH